MPAALQIDKEQVKCVAIQVGYREAARQFGLNENTVMAWAHREGWSEQVKQAQQAITIKREKQGLQAVASVTPSEVLLRLGDRSKLRAAKVGDRTLAAINKRKADELVKASGAYKNTVDALAKVHGWGSESQSSAPLVAIQVVNASVPDA